MGFKWLCLHGAGTNNDMFKSQLASLTYLLRKNHGDEFFFLEGEAPATETDTVDYNGTTDGPFMQYWDLRDLHHYKDDIVKAKEVFRERVLEAHRLVEETCKKHGPFDGIIGYSQGGSLIGDILARRVFQPDTNPLQEAPLKMVIIMGAPPPPDVWCDGDFESAITPERIGSVFETPALFVLGDEDDWHGDVLSFKGCWKPEAARLLEYKGVHTLPSDVAVYEQVVTNVVEIRA